ncbi:MAG TPA: hypothetical protein VIB47_13400 [Dehalococcoidia bacterium]
MRRFAHLSPLATLFAALALSACGGSQPATPDAGGAAGQPPAAPVATEVADPWFLPPPKAHSGASPTLTPGTGSLGQADRDAARRIADALKSAGGSLPGLEVFVFPLKGSANSLLVLDIDTTSDAFTGASATIPAEAGDLLPAGFLTSDAVKQAKVSRVVINVRGRDGTTGSLLLFSMTLPVETLAGYLAGTISEDQAAGLTQFQIKEIKP